MARNRGASIHTLDDGCLLRILSFLAPLPDRFNASRACWRWQRLISDSRMWLSVSSLQGSLSSSDNFENLRDAVSAARPGDTIFIGPGTVHEVTEIHIDKPLCLIGGGTSAEDTVLLSPAGCESALIFSANGKLCNLTIRTELGTCVLHRKGNLTVERCALECGQHPLEHLSCPIVSTADGLPALTSLASTSPGPSASAAAPASSGNHQGDGVYVIETRIEGGAGAVKTFGSLVLQHEHKRVKSVHIS